MARYWSQVAKLKKTHEPAVDLMSLKFEAEFDGLNTEWGDSNFVNPPYSRKLKDAFVIKAIEESKRGKLCVCLLPVSTSTILFHEHIQPNASEIRFLKGRVRFIGVNTFGEKVSNKAGMHDSMIVIFGKEKCQQN